MSRYTLDSSPAFQVRFMFNTSLRALHQMNGKWHEVTAPGLSRIKAREDFTPGVRGISKAWSYKRYWQVKRRMRKYHTYQDELANLAIPALHREGFQE